MKITIDNRDTENIHIDTYGMLTGDSFIEYEIEYLSERDNKSYDYDDFDWSFDHKNIVKQFAIESIGIIENAIASTDYEKIITSIELEKSFSPKYYNYTTDGYKMVVEYDEKALERYTEDNHGAILEIAKKYRAYESDITKNDIVYAGIVHIIQNCITSDDYNMDMWEHELEIYSNNVEITRNGKTIY